jgi:hypothetical protein
MQRRKFSNRRATVLSGTLALLCNPKALQTNAASGDWPEVNYDKLARNVQYLAAVSRHVGVFNIFAAISHETITTVSILRLAE